MTRALLLTISLGCLAAFTPELQADMFGSVNAEAAISPDGRYIVRISKVKRSPEEIEKMRRRLIRRGFPTPVSVPEEKDVAVIYSYNSVEDNYAKQSRIDADDAAPHFLFISNEGDVVFVSLGRAIAP